MKALVFLLFLTADCLARSSSNSARGSKGGSAVSGSRKVVSTNGFSGTSSSSSAKSKNIQRPKPPVIKQKVIINAPNTRGSSVDSLTNLYIGSQLASINRKLTATPPTTVTPSVWRWWNTTPTSTTVTATTKLERLPLEDLFLEDCPSRIDAFVEGRNISFLFQGAKVFVLDRLNASESNYTFSVNSSHLIRDMFPGISRVSAALYQPIRKRMLLFDGRKASMFSKHLDLNEWTADFLAPKDLDDSVDFTPTGAIWYGNQTLLLSDDMKYAVFDEYWNVAVSNGRTDYYLQEFPGEIRGFSQLSGNIYTPRIVYHFDKATQQLTAHPFRDYIDCAS